uniref:Uncharacterized protein n=2 Tax=Trichobilharzia regenti TaxID=157069 RepID=A0AA85K6J0_TRIRE|nr:unnamed protein product [Trichobilharzia regenti]
MTKNMLCVLLFIIQAFTIFSKPGDAVNVDDEEKLYGVENIYSSDCYKEVMKNIVEEETTQDVPATTTPAAEEVKEETTTQDVDEEDKLYGVKNTFPSKCYKLVMKNIVEEETTQDVPATTTPAAEEVKEETTTQDVDEEDKLYGVKNTFPSKCYKLVMKNIVEEETTQDVPATTTPATEEVKEETTTQDVDEEDKLYGVKNTFPSKCYKLVMKNIVEEETTQDVPATTTPATEEVKEETTTQDVDEEDKLYGVKNTFPSKCYKLVMKNIVEEETTQDVPATTTPATEEVKEETTTQDVDEEDKLYGVKNTFPSKCYKLVMKNIVEEETTQDVPATTTPATEEVKEETTTRVNFDYEEEIHGMKNIYPSKCYAIEI